MSAATVVYYVYWLLCSYLKKAQFVSNDRSHELLKRNSNNFMWSVVPQPKTIIIVRGAEKNRNLEILFVAFLIMYMHVYFAC